MARSRVRVLALLSAEISFVGDMREDFRIVGRLNLPFEPDDLLERVIYTLKNEGVDVPSLGSGPFELKSGRVLTVKGRSGSVKLTSTQAKILDCLIGSFGDVVSKEDLYRRILNREPSYDDRSLDQHIFKLRHLLKGEPLRGHVTIETVRGVGYRLVNS
ncbi:hypothetical protein AYJ57_21555 (plasmid) [Salipiger sp. CCB-MM3]|nr:hypothetical protein AYJ57_21555 [Salipiger sp. CCB-MM3]